MQVRERGIRQVDEITGFKEDVSHVVNHQTPAVTSLHGVCLEESPYVYVSYLLQFSSQFGMLHCSSADLQRESK